MFDFRNGMLGVVIVALALGGAIFGAYFAGIESVEHEVVKYNELADVTGLFDTDKSPQYIDYDPSTNYVGYYSQESYSEEMGKYYFAEGEVGYIPNERDGKPIVNNYKIDLKPSDTSQLTVDLSEVSGTDKNIAYLYAGFNEIYRPYFMGNVSTIKLTDYVSGESTLSGFGNITFKNVSEVNWRDPTTLVAFCTDESLVAYRGYADLKNPNLSGDQLKTDDPNLRDATWYAPAIAAEYQVSRNTVILYSDLNMTNQIGVYQADKINILWGGRLTDMTYSTVHSFGSSLDVVGVTFPPSSYLDPNKGVYLKGDE